MIKFGNITGADPKNLKEAGVEFRDEVQHKPLPFHGVLEVRGKEPLKTEVVNRKSVTEVTGTINKRRRKNHAKKSSYLNDILGE